MIFASKGNIPGAPWRMSAKNEPAERPVLRFAILINRSSRSTLHIVMDDRPGVRRRERDAPHHSRHNLPACR